MIPDSWSASSNHSIMSDETAPDSGIGTDSPFDVFSVFGHDDIDDIVDRDCILETHQY